MKVENGLFGYHGAPIQWNIQTDHWSSSDPATGIYDPYMDTSLISPEIAAGTAGLLTVGHASRYQTNSFGYGNSDNGITG